MNLNKILNNYINSFKCVDSLCSTFEIVDRYLLFCRKSFPSDGLVHSYYISDNNKAKLNLLAKFSRNDEKEIVVLGIDFNVKKECQEEHKIISIYDESITDIVLEMVSNQYIEFNCAFFNKFEVEGFDGNFYVLKMDNENDYNLELPTMHIALGITNRIDINLEAKYIYIDRLPVATVNIYGTFQSPKYDLENNVYIQWDFPLSIIEKVKFNLNDNGNNIYLIACDGIKLLN